VFRRIEIDPMTTDNKIKDQDVLPEIKYPLWYKIFLVSLIPTAALLVAAFVNHQYLSSLGRSAEQILSKNYKSIRAAQEIRKILEDFHDPDAIERMSSAAGEDPTAAKVSALEIQLKICEDNITEPGEKTIIQRLTLYFLQLRPAVRQGDLTGDSVSSTGERVRTPILARRMISTIDELVAINEKAMESADRHTKDLARKAQRNAAVLFAAAVVALMAINYFLSYRIARPVMTLARSLAEASEKKGFYPRYLALSNDEIGFLTRSFNQLFQQLEQYDNYRDDILAAEKNKVFRVEEAKNRFVADISHQIKTPMTSLAMSVGLLHDRVDGLAPDRRLRLIETAHDDCIRLSTLINELVDMTRLDAMIKPRPRETLNIVDVIRECISPLLKQAEEKKVSIVIDAQEDLPPVTIDSFRFPWVFTNLLGNALRYTDALGEVRFSVLKQGTRLYFTCSDTGTGIKPEYLPRIFDRYTQFADRERSGTIGLGLAIVKDIIEQHGGDIRVSSRIGKGTRFTFWIPAYMENGNGKSSRH
jgi:signal transduction histidine kinase